MRQPLSPRVRRTGMRAAWIVVLLAAACGSQQATTLDASTPTTPGTLASATPTAAPLSPSSGTTPGPASAGGQATVSATTAPGSPPPSLPAATIHPTGKTTVVRDDDSGTGVHLLVGQRLQVQLTQNTYDPPTSSSTVLMRRSSSGGYPTHQPVNAVFEAASRGPADVTATSDAACFHTQPRCMMATRMWIVHVTVT